ncbi:conserved hypothetical protein [Burkholderia pseudomallei 576]|nr:conserved hypothetical protein [Burkholderia pseudomallei 576]
MNTSNRLSVSWQAQISHTPASARTGQRAMYMNPRLRHAP